MRITTDLGELIRNLRDARGFTRRELAEQAGVSVSHLEKIESGQRSPGMGTFVKIMVELDVNINLHSTGSTVQEECIIAMQDIVLSCTEGEARYLTHMVKCMADGFSLMV